MGLEINNSTQFLTFAVLGEEYAVELLSVKEIKGWADITRLPNAPSHLRGVLDLRGTVVPIFDLRTVFNTEHTEITSESAIIILSYEARLYGALVDSVTDILAAHPNDIQPAPEINQAGIDFIRGLISSEQRLIVLLELNHLFSASMHQYLSLESQKQVG